MTKILFLIDDDQDDREVFTEAVANCDPGIVVVSARDGVEAIRVLDSGNVKPDVIFLDYNMPKMNGLECLRMLKKDERTKYIPTIMYTTSGDREQENVLMMVGADYYLRKTISFKTLCTELQKLFGLLENNVDLRTVRHTM